MHYQLIEAPLIGERDSVMFLEGRHVPIVAPFERNEVVYQRSHRFFFFADYHEPIGRQTLEGKKRFLETRVDHLAQTYSQQSRAPNSNLDTACVFTCTCPTSSKNINTNGRKRLWKRSFVVSLLVLPLD